jgi:hypothetical protein
MIMEHRWNDNDRGRPKYLEKICSSVNFSTTNPKQTDLGSKLALRGEDLKTNFPTAQEEGLKEEMR